MALGRIVKEEKLRDVIKEINNDGVFQSEKQSVAVVHIAGIGTYCKNKRCGKKIFAKHATYRLNGAIVKRIVKREYCSNRCWHQQNQKNTRKANLYARINLKVINDKTPFRTMFVYFKTGTSPYPIKITKESKELWQYLERVSRYRGINETAKKEKELILVT